MQNSHDDKLTVINPDTGITKFILTNNEIIMLDHKHVFNKCKICKICLKSKKELLKEKVNINGVK